MLNFKLITKKLIEKFISRSKKISLAFRKIFKKPIIGIIDIGAGHRYLPFFWILMEFLELQWLIQIKVLIGPIKILKIINYLKIYLSLILV